MKSATVRELRNDYSKVLGWVAKGEEVQVTRRGKVVARVLPPATSAQKCAWPASAAFTRQSWPRKLSAKESAEALAESKSRW